MIVHIESCDNLKKGMIIPLRIEIDAKSSVERKLALAYKNHTILKLLFLLEWKSRDSKSRHIECSPYPYSNLVFE